MTESAKKYFIKIAGLHLGTTFLEDDWDKDIIGIDELDNFLKHENVLILFAVIEEIDDNKRMKFFRNLQKFSHMVIFNKYKPSVSSEDNFLRFIQTTTLSDSPALALYNSLYNIYTPLLKLDEKSNLPRQIANLQNDLRSAILLSGTNENDDIPSRDEISNIYTVVDSLEHEISHWHNITPNAKKDKISRGDCNSFKDLLSTIAGDFSIIEALSITDAEDLLERAHNVLDDLWRHTPPYPKDRIKHIIDIIASDVWKYSCHQLKKVDLWTDDYIGISDVLQQQISIGEKWLGSCKQLTEIFWPNHSGHPWKEEVYQPMDLVKSVSALRKVLNIRTFHKQLMKLLTPQEQEELKTKEMLQCFQDIDLFLSGQDLTHELMKAEKKFEYYIQPAERRVALKLKKQFDSVNTNTRQLIYEYSRYSELICRPILRRELLIERQFLMVSLYDYVKQIQMQSAAENFAVSTRFDTPRIVREISLVRQLEGKAEEVRKVSEKLLSDLQNYGDLSEVVSEMVKDLRQQHDELFESWCSEIVGFINDNTLSLKESDPVVQFSEEKLMRVNYSPRLVVLISEVRQLKAMGYHIPSVIEEISEHAKKFMRFARILEQIANFHNTIGDRMIQSQKPMMLASALELSKLVQDQEVVSWGEAKSVERYVSTMKTAVEKLSKENDMLTMYNTQIVDKINDLQQYDLIKDLNKWKDTTKQIRNMLSQVEDKGFRNMSSWKNDLDTKLSEVLEKQYLDNLNTLHVYLPEIQVDLIYRNSKLEYLPSEENLKKAYDQQLKKFLDIPKNFRMISDTPNNTILHGILERHATALENVSKCTEDLFEQLKGVMRHWQSWLQLETLDTSKLVSWQHWDLHFRASKTFGQEIAKLPVAEERVGCFLIGLSRLRSDLESHNRSYWDQLVHSLKDSIAQDVVKLQNYVDHSTSALTKQPVTIDEVGQSSVIHNNIMKDGPEMLELFNEMSKKSQILASWSREQVSAVSRLKAAWDRLQSLLDNHQHIMAKQMETIKTTLNIERENLEKEIERFQAKWEDSNHRLHSGQLIDNSMKDLANRLKKMKDRRNEWKEVEKKKEKLLNDFTRFSIDLPDLSHVGEIEEKIAKEEESWSIFEDFMSEFDELLNEAWIVFRKKIFKLEDFLKRWREKLLQVDNNELVTRLLQEIHTYEAIAPLLKYVKGEDFSEKHWVDTFSVLQMDVKPVDQLVLHDFLDVADKIQESLKELQLISKKAASEIVVRQALAELEHWDVHCRFSLVPQKDSRNVDVSLVQDFKEILNKIGDNQSLLQSLKNSADSDAFIEKVTMWETKFGDLDHHLVALAQIQRKWLYLEPIFGSGTLAQEKSRFDRIDRDFRHILNYIEKDLRVAALCRFPNIRSLLETITDQLSRCQNSLDDFLKQKREKFPRFLFLSDDDLLEVVGQSTKEQVIQTHLKKIFVGIDGTKLSSNGQDIVAMCSSHGETVNLSNPVNIQKPVEDWLNDLVKQMQVSLKELLVTCQREKSSPDPLSYPSQILCLSESITFTARCEQAISSMTIPPLLAKYKTQLNHYSSLELNRGIDVSEVDNVLELKLKALLLDTIHHIHVLEELLDQNVTKVSDWTWQKQLRYYANSVGEVTVKMALARMEYSYEYLGNAQKLVRTPLTDRCFLTSTQGIHLGMGGNPYGPAGTGKTESVKALGGLLGRQVLVFNCDEGIDVTAMGRILTGLVKTGAWGCFDEFNRLDEATLSAISMLIHAIQVAIRSNKDFVNLLDEEVSVDKHCGIFVTLNPAGGCYGGRNNLPDNLKQLFRPVVMTQPDNEEIAKALLHCDGYRNADVIAKKLVEVFDMSSKLLSNQQHYDWGLRSIRTILGGCGRSLRRSKAENSSLESFQDTVDEMGIVVQVLKLDILSKLSSSDSLKFQMLVKDVFRGVEEKVLKDDVLRRTIEECFEELGLVKNGRQIDKCLEFYEQLQQRMGVAIIGPPKCGKSTIRNLMSKALYKIGKHVRSYCFNPKSMTRSQLLGRMDLDTSQWNDGVLTNFSLQVTSESSEIWSWIVCDGEIDPDWIESLNTVLDDNRLLSLPSGWRVRFGPNVNFVFESDCLGNASPATVSRLGIVFLGEEDLGLESFVAGHVDGLKEDMGTLVTDHFVKAVQWLTTDGEISISSSQLSIAETGLTQLIGVESRPHFCVALINGLGQQLQDDFREVFAQQVFDWTGETPPPLILRSRYNKERDIIESYNTNPNIILGDVRNGVPLIETGQVSQYLDTLRVWFKEKCEQHLLMVGPHGSAKSLILKSLVNERTDLDIVTLHCSANLQPSFVINKLLEHCLSVNTHKGKLLKPKKGYLVLYLKNLHLLKQDKWGTNILIEFLNQMMVYRGFFDSNVEFIGVENVMIVGSLDRTGNLPKRFLSNMRLFNMSLPEPEEFPVIVTAYLTAILKICFPKYNCPKVKVVKISTTMINIYDRVRNTFVNTRKKQHYDFSPHDVTNWCSGFLRYKRNDSLTDIDGLISEIIHSEALDIFGNRLVHEEDRNTLYKILGDTFKAQWGNEESSKGQFYVPVEDGYLTKLTKTEWSDIVQQGILQYEREGQTLDLILTDELLHLTACVMRTVGNSGGNSVLVGRCGVGRKSAIKIASAIQLAKLVVPLSEKQPQLNNDLKMAMQYAGIEGQQVFFQIEDFILREDNNLDIFHSLIASGEVPNLYSMPELDSIVKVLKDEYERDNFDGTLLQYFSHRVKCNLHLLICLDVDNENLWDVFHSCPSIMHSSLIWMEDWSSYTVEEIPKTFLDRNKKLEDETCISSCHKGFSTIYQITRSRISTPSRFISMMKLYENVYERNLNRITSRQQKLRAGVAKLTEAESLVKELKQKAEEKQIKLEEKQSKANSALDMISNTMKNANSQKEQMESLKSKTQEENIQLMRRKKEIEEELSEVEPLIEQARSAVGNIKSEALSEIRSLRAPPEIIRDILEGVLRLMGIQDTSWNSMKTFLAKRGVKEEIRSFDASRISRESRQAVERLMAVKSDSFDQKSAKRASIAAAPLASWVAANVKYSYVMDNIRPLEKEQNKLKQNLSTAEAQLGELSVGLLDVDATVAHLKEQLSAFTKEAAEIEIDLKRAQTTLSAAEGLVSKLSNEYDRWQEQLKELSGQIEDLPKNCLLMSAFMTYLSSESEEKREQLSKLWSKEIGVENIDIETFFSTERDRMQWQSEGLSSDKMSIQNAVIILNADTVPLLIDPTSSASNWIKQHLKHTKVECTNQNSPKFVGALELAVRFGKTLIIEEVDTVSPVLFQILRREFTHQGERKLIKMNGKLMDYHNEFKLILCSRNEKLNLPPEIIPLVNSMNFTVTHAGLTEQLLSATIRQENPELENRKKQLLKEREVMEEKLNHLQNQLLEDLGSSTGDILQDSKLLESLNRTKASSEEIATALKESIEVRSKLESEYDIYRKIADFGSSLYFACDDFAKSNIIYLLSVNAFTNLFLESLLTYQAMGSVKGHDSDVQQRHLFLTVYNYMSRGIFKLDRLKFLLFVIHKLYPRSIPDSEWALFLGNTIAHKSISDEVPPWIPKNCISGIQNLKTALPEFYDQLKLEEANLWKSFVTSSNCVAAFPTHCTLAAFQKVLVVQALRPDSLFSMMSQSAMDIAGLRTLDPPALELASLSRESSSGVPILIFAMSGTDPISEIKELAEESSRGFLEVAMGEGQEAKALSALKKSSESGTWLVLKNLHLVTNWLTVLTQNFKSLESCDGFRLWLISEPTPYFNPVLAQNSLKIVYEASQGISNNMQRTYTTFGSTYIEKLNPNSARIFFALAAVHAIVQERRKYIPQGWSKYYDFSDTDLSTNVKLVEDLWHDQSPQTQWRFVRGLTSDAGYGGRIETDDDMEVLRSYVQQYFDDGIMSHEWKPFGLNSSLPNGVSFQEYLRMIKQLPNTDVPSVFGLSENINRAWEKQTSMKLISELKNFYLSKNTTSKFDHEEFAKGLTPFMVLWKKLNQGHDFLRMTTRKNVSEGTATATFLVEEFDEALQLIQMIHKCFAFLKKFSKGSVDADPLNYAVGSSLMNYETPPMWLDVWNGPKEPIQYLKTVINKVVGLSEWKERNVGDLIRSPLNLSTLFHPEKFLASHKQDFARSSQVAIDELILRTSWRANTSSLILTDLLVEGGLFENGEMKHCTANSENINNVPNCYLSWTNKSATFEEESSLNVPVFTNSTREKKVFSLQIPCDKKGRMKWIQCGLAFYLEY